MRERTKPILDPAQTLADAREEQFAQLLSSGSTQVGAYEAVYRGSDKGNASKKANQPRVKARVHWIRTQAGQAVVEQLVAKTTTATAEVVAKAVTATVLTRQYVIDGLTKNARIAMGDELVTVKKIGKDEDGNPQVIEAKVTMRDAGAANRALELLGKEVGLFEGEGARDDKDKTERAPIKTTDNERAVAFLERHFSGRTPAAILGKKFLKTVGNA